MTPATTTTTPAINYFRVVVAGDYAIVPDFHRFHVTGNYLIGGDNDSGDK